MNVQRPHDPADADRNPPLLGRPPRDPRGPSAPTPSGIDEPLSTNALPDDDAGAESVPVVSGRLGTWEEAERVRRALLDDGCEASDVELFYTGPAGRHAVTELGGDAHADAGSTRIGAGAAKGAAAGAAAGLAVGAAVATAPVAGAVVLTAAAIGAFGGALVGGVTASEDGAGKPDTAEHPVAKPGGVVVAVRVDRVREGEALALRRLREGGAIALERATARWRDGRWIDWSATEPREQIAPRPGVPQA